MINALVRFTVEDFSKWKSVFEEAAALRKTYGSLGAQAFHKVDVKNEIFVFLRFESIEKAGEMFQSTEFREVTRRGGMVAPPEVTFLNEVINLPA